MPILHALWLLPTLPYSTSNTSPLRQQEKDHKGAEPPELNACDCPCTIEGIEEWLKGCNGVNGVPLLYVVHPVSPKHDRPSTNYEMIQDELITHTPIQDDAGKFGLAYLSDCAIVWEKYSKLTQEHDCWTYVHPAQCARDGHLTHLG